MSKSHHVDRSAAVLPAHGVPAALDAIKAEEETVVSVEVETAVVEVEVLVDACLFICGTANAKAAYITPRRYAIFILASGNWKGLNS